LRTGAALCDPVGECQRKHATYVMGSNIGAANRWRVAPHLLRNAAEQVPVGRREIARIA
jgi:hypothetical protein